MADTGAKLPGMGADDSSVGTLTWGTPSNITILDNTAAGAGTSGTTHYLKGTNFNFSSIPSGATIDGVQLLIRRSQTDISGGVSDSVVRLVKGGTVSGANKSTGASWPASNVNVTYGGPTDLWGLTLTDTDVKDSSFGAVLSAVCSGDSGFVRYFQMTIYYTGGSSTSTAVFTNHLRTQGIS